jgi:hypothetical protein
MTFNRLERHVQLVRDLPVRPAVGRKPRDPQLARSKRVDAGTPLAARAGTGRLELLAGASSQSASAAAGRELQRLGERLTPSGALAGAA